ncbi:MAG: nuclear transport factor 2 family protein [Saprospiraceae bacterium]
MQFKLGLIAAFILTSSLCAWSQEKEELAVRETIERFFAGIRKGDSSAVHTQLLPDCRMLTTYYKTPDKPEYKEENVKSFLKSVGTAHQEVWDERILSYDIRVDEGLASVWTNYAFYSGKQYSHSGVNAFQLIKTSKQWKISQIIDTRRKKNKYQAPISTIDSLLNQWHKAAAKADENVFFGSMTEDAVYIGTDETEFWKRDELKKWSEKYFARDSAWTFHPFERHIYISDDGQTAWWDEKLHTGMGLCRGSGTWSLIGGNWKMRQFVLSLALPNDKLDAFKDMMKTELPTIKE